MKAVLALWALLYTRLLSDGSDSDSGDSGSGESSHSGADSALFLSSGGTDPNQQGSSYYSSDGSSDDPTTRRAARAARGQPTDPSAAMSAGDLQDIPPG